MFIVKLAAPNGKVYNTSEHESFGTAYAKFASVKNCHFQPESDGFSIFSGKTLVGVIVNTSLIDVDDVSDDELEVE